MRPARILLSGIALFVVLVVPAEAQQAIFLVRHAEPTSDPGDSPLAPEGKARAQDLARLLGDAGVTAIYTSPALRAIQTAEPLAKKLGLTIDKNSTDDSAAFVSLLKRRHPEGVILVVGHSNTVPELLRALGYNPTPPIEFLDGYDNLFIVTPGGAARPTVVRLRYGK